MKNVIILLFFLILSTSFYSQRMYGGSGRIIGRINDNRLYDGSGRIIGRIDGNRLYDGSGRIIGRSDKMSTLEVILFFYFYM